LVCQLDSPWVGTDPILPTARHRSAGHRLRRADDARLFREQHRANLRGDRRAACRGPRAPWKLHGRELRNDSRRRWHLDFGHAPNRAPIAVDASAARVTAMSADHIDFWFSMGSTYSYLSVMRLGELERASGIRFNWRPFHLLIILQEMKHIPFADKPAKAAYMSFPQPSPNGWRVGIRVVTFEACSGLPA
jgi:DSBA-like thioredoxin domain